MCIAMTACKKGFLDTHILGKETIETNPDLAEDLVTGAYNSLLLSETWGDQGEIHGFGFLGATNILSDDAEKGSTAGDQAVLNEFENLNMSANNNFINAIWKGHYTGIGRINNALTFIEESKSLTDVKKNQYIGELKFLRAYLYFNMVRFFGDVPKVTRIATSPGDAYSDAAFSTRAPKAEIYNEIILPDMLFASRNLSDNINSGRIHKYVAMGMLSKVYLYLKDYSNAYKYADSVIKSNKYTLENNYASLFREKSFYNSEVIFQVQTGSFNNNNLGVGNYTVCQGPRVGGMGGWDDLGWGFCNPTATLRNAYETGDLRKAATIITIDQSGNHKGTVLWDGFRIPSKDSVENSYYNYKAYASKGAFSYAKPADKDRNKNIYLLRFAEILLIHAEAANEIGKSSEAVNDLNAVRLRAGLPNTGAAGGAALLNAIWQERHVELALEHDRYFDLVRTGQAQQAFLAAGKTFVVGKHEVLPIPAIQITLTGGKLSQNPNY